MSRPYVKINTCYQRDEKGVIDIMSWATPEIGYLASNSWLWTEKVDGTNIRLEYAADGSFRGNEHAFINGRSDQAQIPPFLVDALVALMEQAPFETVFPDLDGASVTLYGEGYGPRIQKGGNYGDTPAFVLFDVMVGDWWLRWEDVKDVGRRLGVDVVPEVGIFPIRKSGFGLGAWPGAPRDAAGLPIVDAETLMTGNGFVSRWGDHFQPEGIVGRPLVDLNDRAGRRVLTKLKFKDYERWERINGPWMG